MEGGGSARFLARLLIGILCAAALILIAVIGSGSELDETGSKAIGMAVAFAFFCLAGVAGTNLARRRPHLALFGYATAAIAVAAFLATTTLRPSRLVRSGVLLAITMLCTLAIIEISSPGKDIGVHPIAVVAVLYLLGTILLPLLRRASSRIALLEHPSGVPELAENRLGVVAWGLRRSRGEDPLRLRPGGTDVAALDQIDLGVERQYLAAASDRADPRVSLLRATDLSGLPPTYIRHRRLRPAARRGRGLHGGAARMGFG